MKQIRRALTLLTAVLLVSCAGGGTTGTGGFSVQGTVGTTTLALTPVAGIKVTAVGTDAQDTSDSNGNFYLDLSSHPTNLTLRFQSGTKISDVQITNIPDGAATLVAEFSVNETDGEVTEDNSKYEDGNGNDL